mmetsp:Transcript_34126/g.77870  ORF Transcript_34126/g.77870 Transcript_34126/m.77870 type:complete len:229 (-) Transcript_34126:419-1105(-)
MRPSVLEVVGSLAAGLSIVLRLVVQDSPVEHKVILVTFTEEQVFQQPAQVGIVWTVLKAQASTVVEVGHELSRKVLAQHFYGCGHLLLHDLLVFFLLGVGLQALPRQAATIEVHEHIANGLQVIPPALLDPQVGIHTCIASCPCQVLVLPIRNVLLCLRVPVLLSKTEVNDVNLIGLLAKANEEVVRLDVAVNEVLGMNVLDAIDHLVCQHQDCFQTELPIAEAEQIF